MIDRELLELAAKAAGITGAWSDRWNCFHIAEHLSGDADEARAARRALGLSADNRIWWGPLTDDGDALRLGVKLRLQITVGSDGVHVEGLPRGDMLPYAYEPFEAGRSDDEATCRAIVRVAAEIGRATP